MISLANLMTDYERESVHDQDKVPVPKLYHPPAATKLPRNIRDNFTNAAWCERERQDVSRPRLVFTHVNGKLSAKYL